MDNQGNPFCEEVLVEFEGELRKLEINEQTEDPFSIDGQNSECTSVREVLNYYGKNFWYSLEDYRNGKPQSLFERIKHIQWADPDTGEVFEEDLSDLEAK